MRNLITQIFRRRIRTWRYCHRDVCRARDRTRCDAKRVSCRCSWRDGDKSFRARDRADALIDRCRKTPTRGIRDHI